MNLHKLILTNNACYKTGKTITPKGIMVHSTGANNPNLKRYVGPDDGLLGKNQYNNHWNQDNPDGRQVCVHGFIGKQYGFTEEGIICHSEGASLGIASSHSDVMHWFPKHGKSMDTFWWAFFFAYFSSKPPEIFQ